MYAQCLCDCVCVCVCGGGGGYSHLSKDIHVCPVFVCGGGGVLSIIYLSSSLVHEATVCRSVSFIWASKGFVIELVCWSV